MPGCEHNPLSKGRNRFVGSIGEKVGVPYRPHTVDEPTVLPACPSAPQTNCASASIWSIPPEPGWEGSRTSIEVTSSR